MRAKLILLILGLCAGSSYGQTTITGDAWITGKMGVGTTAPTARLEVQASSITQTVFQVSGVDETPFLTVGSSGAVGVGVTPSASLDVNGSADSGAVGLALRSGNLYPASSGIQMAFGYNGTSNLRHAIRTTHSTTTANSSMDFLIWNTAVAPTAVASLDVLSLVTTTTVTGAGAAGVHILPVAATLPDVELEVSNGSAIGGGVMERYAEVAPSSREFKKDISYITPEEEKQGVQDVLGLKHASYRYKSYKKKKLVRDTRQPLMRGLIYEDSPKSIQGTGSSVALDQRVINAELAMKDLMRRIAVMQAETDKLK